LATLRNLRRAVLLLLAAALILASAASAAFQPIRRSYGEFSLPRLRAGTLKVPAAHSQGRVTVLVDLRLPPLAAYNRNLFSTLSTSRLNVRSSSSRLYLNQLARAQRAAAAELGRAIPSARISYRYRVVLDGFAVSLPARKLPTLARLNAVTKVYPSVRYALDTNQSPAVIGADQMWATTGDRGDGVKIGIVDDGIDQSNPFFSPTGFSYPAGFPRGQTKFTTQKVIVARSFPGPGSGAQGKLPLYRQASFHGTHVAGIAAGDAGTTAPAGPDHPTVTGLSGVAPRAWLGNYRVFNTPTPTGYDAFTPQIVAAFESAVNDGMDVINFSGGGPQVDPISDALVEAVRNVSNAGVVPVIAAGNDRDDWGLGSVGSPGTAPDAISVAAVSNSHVFAPSLSATTGDAPASLKNIPFQDILPIPDAWTSADHTLVDVGAIVGTDGSPVERHLCGVGSDPNSRGTLPPDSVRGSIVLVSRGTCAFVTKAANAELGGAAGIVLVDNRPGEANFIPLQLSLDAGMVSDLDGARLRAYLDSKGGRAPVRFTKAFNQLNTGRSGVITSFSSAGPTDFDHQLKPDLAAPGGQILSATLPEALGEPFAVFDGTSMATPHVAGAAALLIARHPDWTPAEVKSALMSTAGPAWGDTARTQEASVLLEGAGLANVPRADDPKLFTTPVSLSFQDLDVTAGSARRSLLLEVQDAGGGGGTWTVGLQSQAATAGAFVDLPATVAVSPGGTAEIPVVVRADANAATGDDEGFVTLTQGSNVRRVPYYFTVERPGAEITPVVPLKKLQTGDTRTGKSNINRYRFPGSPFGPAPTYTGTPMDESGGEKLYSLHISQPVANVGAAIVAASPGSSVEPWLLGSRDENDVQGYAATPVNANVLTSEYRLDVGVAGAVFPREKRYYVAVDSGRDVFTGRSLAGAYVLRSWVNDLTPPRFRLLTKRVTAGRPLLAARVTDLGSGVDPLSLVIEYRNNVLLGASLYDPSSGLALFGIPRTAPPVRHGLFKGAALAADNQESKNVDQIGANVLPNTTIKRVNIRGTSGPTVTWLLPLGTSCVKGSASLAVAASAPGKIRTIRFFDGKRLIKTVRKGTIGLYTASWRTGAAKRGPHKLRVVVQSRGRVLQARRNVRVCH
jgi:minor extracellular serine protease Vpr